jgi:threonine aldolase
MAEAEVGDDVLDGDPTVAKLERRAAEWLGKEGALFVPSGTMANQVALGAWLRPGDELVAEQHAHVVTWEAGAAGALHGAQVQTLSAPDGRIAPEALARAVRASSLHCPKTALLCLEQTYMGSGEGAGGCVVPLAHLQELARAARGLGLAIHMDGARLANAVVASGAPASAHAACADSVSICLSKGLGAPVGSLIAGDRAFLERARLVRKRLGGWMRQSGILAAAGLYALEHNLSRLAEDHALARTVARLLVRFRGLELDPERIETNLVFARVTRPDLDAPTLAARLAREGVLVSTMNRRCLRLVTHLDVGSSDVARLERSLASCLGG